MAKKRCFYRRIIRALTVILSILALPFLALFCLAVIAVILLGTIFAGITEKLEKSYKEAAPDDTCSTCFSYDEPYCRDDAEDWEDEEWGD